MTSTSDAVAARRRRRWLADLGFWLVYGGTAAVILYAVYCAAR